MYKGIVDDIDSSMQEIETKYKFKRSDRLGVFNIKDSEESDKYARLSMDLKIRTRLFKSYTMNMENWKDGASGEGSFVNHNGTKFTNIERVTLANGQHAYKASKNGGEIKYYYPYWDGTVGGPEISPEKLEEIEQNNK